MALDEQLRELANRVPPPPPGDATDVLRRGRRRRRARHAVTVTAAVSVVAVLGVGVASLLEGPAQLDIADRPPTQTEQPEGEGALEDWPVIVGPPSLVLSGSDPFPWEVAVSPGEDDRWCVTTARGGSQVEDATGEPCDQLLTPEQVGDPDGFGTGGSEVEAAPGGAPTQGLSWGFAPVGVEEVFVQFTDGTREQAGVATGGDVPAPLWAIGYERVEVQAVEAHRDGEVVVQGSQLPLPDPGSALPAELDDGTPVFVSHLADGEVYVLDATSPHQDITLVAYCTRNGGFEDVRHGSRFTADGLWLGGPAPSGLAVYPHVRAGSDHVRITGAAEPRPRSDSERLPETIDHGPYCFDTETGDHVEDAVYHLPGEPPSAGDLTLRPARWQWTRASFEFRDDTLFMCAQDPCGADALQVPVPHEGWLTSFERTSPDLLVLARPHGDARAEIRLPALDTRADDVTSSATSPTEGS